MRHCDCQELELRNMDGAVLCSNIVGFLWGDEETDTGGTFHQVVLSMPRSLKVAPGQSLLLWNKVSQSWVLKFTVTSSRYDFSIPANKIEGRYDVPTCPVT